MIRPVAAPLSVSIHAFRGEGDAVSVSVLIWFHAFQSTPSGGKATDNDADLSAHLVCVSIHAFRGEGDWMSGGWRRWCAAFQSTPSGGKATSHTGSISLYVGAFQSTPSGGKATAISRAAVPCSRQIL